MTELGALSTVPGVLPATRLGYSRKECYRWVESGLQNFYSNFQF